MGKVHGSLARAGKVRGQTPKGTLSYRFDSRIDRQSIISIIIDVVNSRVYFSGPV